MNIKTKLLIQFSLIVVTILLVFTTGVYFFSANYRETEYYSRLEDRGKTTARLLLEENVGEEMLKVIDKNTVALFQEQLVIYGPSGDMIYRNPPTSSPLSSLKLLETIRTRQYLKFQIRGQEALGIKYLYENQPYVIVISAFDKYGFSKLTNLRIILIVGFMVGAFATFAGGMFFARRALSPIAIVIQEVNAITGANLNKRLNEGGQKDEIAKLAMTFNQMLDRIENAFNLQKEFVANAAHELRTPFTVLLAEVDYSLMQPRDNTHYRMVLTNLAGEIRKLSKLSNGLLDLARFSFDNTWLHPTRIRVDELVLETCNIVKEIDDTVDIILGLDHLPENEKYLCVNGNEQLLTIAFKNIMENALKFSNPKAVTISIEGNQEGVHVHFSDQGIGIHEGDLIRIFEPFYRGRNTHFIAGYGIGLSLTQRIVELHSGVIHVQSVPGSGSTFSLTLPLASEY
jgi:two-component system, OmpR family, sensor histidine kinase ArlS